MKLDWLIETLEVVTEGSDPLDRAIRNTLDLPAMLVPPDGGDEAYPYTTSVDAALMLVPEGYVVREITIWPGQPSTVAVWEAHQSEGDPSYWHSARDGRWNAEAKTPALALCIAALKARNTN